MVPVDLHFHSLILIKSFNKVSRSFVDVGRESCQVTTRTSKDVIFYRVVSGECVDVCGWGGQLTSGT